MAAAKVAERYPDNPFFLNMLGCPKLDKNLNAYVMIVDNLDHCGRPNMLWKCNITDRVVNFISRPRLANL